MGSKSEANEAWPICKVGAQKYMNHEMGLKSRPSELLGVLLAPHVHSVLRAKAQVRVNRSASPEAEALLAV